MTLSTAERADLLTQIWWAGVWAVAGDEAVRRSLTDHPIPRPDLILALGKAAVPMARAAHEVFGSQTLAVTKQGHTEPGTPFPVLQSAHPVPDASSLAAGQALLDAVTSAAPGSHLLLLMSGGASALAEVPHPGFALNDLITLNRALLASGKDIATMNAERSRFSQIKGGGLLSHFRGARVTVLAISDTAGDRIETIGSGTGLALSRPDLTSETRIVASNTHARAAAAAKAAELGLTVHSNAETLYADITTCAVLIARGLPREPGLAIWGGEPTVILPPNPGQGGRNQALALMMAWHLPPDTSMLVAGTDGTDGPTGAAGGLVTASTWGAGAEDALRRADSGTYLAHHHALFTTGPTGTNVMDLALTLKT